MTNYLFRLFDLVRYNWIEEKVYLFFPLSIWTNRKKEIHSVSKPCWDASNFIWISSYIISTTFYYWQHAIKYTRNNTVALVKPSLQLKSN